MVSSPIPVQAATVELDEDGFFDASSKPVSLFIQDGGISCSDLMRKLACMHVDSWILFVMFRHPSAEGATGFTYIGCWAVWTFNFVNDIALIVLFQFVLRSHQKFSQFVTQFKMDLNASLYYGGWEGTHN